MQLKVDQAAVGRSSPQDHGRVTAAVREMQPSPRFPAAVALHSRRSALKCAAVRSCAPRNVEIHLSIRISLPDPIARDPAASAPNEADEQHRHMSSNKRGRAPSSFNGAHSGMDLHLEAISETLSRLAGSGLFPAAAFTSHDAAAASRLLAAAVDRSSTAASQLVPLLGDALTGAWSEKRGGQDPPAALLLVAQSAAIKDVSLDSWGEDDEDVEDAASEVRSLRRLGSRTA